MKKNLDITKAPNSEQILPVPCIFGLSALYLRFQCTRHCTNGSDFGILQKWSLKITSIHSIVSNENQSLCILRLTRQS